MKAHLTRRYMFSSSHRLHANSMPDEWNRATYGKCNNPYGHGHNYHLEVTVSGPVDPATGMVCNLVDLDSIVRKNVLERYDLENLNTLPEFAAEVPTTENLCIEIFNRLKSFPGARLVRVRLEETGRNSFQYEGEPEGAET